MKEKLKSRKLWITILSAVLFGVMGDYASVSNIVLAYIGGQSVVDAFKEAKK